MWKDLSMREKAALIKMAVDNEVYDLGDIKDTYNKFTTGGPLNDTPPPQSGRPQPQRSTNRKKRFWETEEEYQQRLQREKEWEEYKRKNFSAPEETEEENAEKARKTEETRQAYLNSPEVQRKIAEEKAAFKKMFGVKTQNSKSLERAAALTDNIAQSQRKQVKQLQQDINTAINQQEEQRKDEAKQIQNFGYSMLTRAELGLSGLSLLGAYSNWRKWKTASSVVKRAIGNLLQKAQKPSQIGGTVIDTIQAYDAFQKDDTAEGIYNGLSGLLGIAGSIGASDIFRSSRYYRPTLDNAFDIAGVTQNALDFAKKGAESLLGVDSIFNLGTSDTSDNNKE